MSVDRAAFRAASEAAESWVNTVAQVAKFGRSGTDNGVDLMLTLLTPLKGVKRNLHDDYHEHVDLLKRMQEQMAVVSDGPVKWEHGRGVSGVARVPASVFPHVWSSAHEAAVYLAGLTLDWLGLPLTEIADPAKLTKTDRNIVVNRCKALAMSPAEVADWQERIRRERAKLLSRMSQVEREEQTEEKVSLLERVLAVLTPNQSCIIKYLWERRTASFDTLATVPGAWQDVPSDEAITKKLKEMRTRLEKENLTNFVGDITISTAKRRVTIERPAD
jgi:hypothetical protein